MSRNYMEKQTSIYFTSDFGEGWGAVLYEAMNSGCALGGEPCGIGAVPPMLKT
jgi:hypothetical protein